MERNHEANRLKVLVQRVRRECVLTGGREARCTRCDFVSVVCV